jgi:SAM-dependent methyltransferase
MFCRVCDATNFYLGVDLGMQPWGNHFLKKEQRGTEPFYPLRVLVCERCSTAQLDYTVKKEVMFSDHTYLSGITQSLREHFQNTAKTVDERFFKEKAKKSILDIGSNDGTQLKAYQNLGYDVLGVESAKQVAQIAIQNGVPTFHAFFNLETARQIGRLFDVINASGVFFHLEELHSVAEAIQSHLAQNGVFVVQFLYMKTIMENVAFDQIYHEHLLFYTLKTLDVLLDRHGLALFDAEFSPIHGGSMIGYVGHRGQREPSARLLKLKEEELHSGCNEKPAYQRFSQQIEQSRERNLRFLGEKRRQGKTIYGMGAPVKGNTLLNYFDIGTDTLAALIEKNELRKGLYSPGKHIPIWIERELTNPPDVYYVLAWNFKKEILRNNQKLIDSGVEFYFPIETA